jgi:hypothetical protein
MAQKTVTLEIDKEQAMLIASQLLDNFDGRPLEETSTNLFALVATVLQMAKSASKYATKKGMVEKMILGWIAASDQLGDTQFSKYINLEKE